jgi:23S rRNA pseudouridine2605 synthase
MTDENAWSPDGDRIAKALARAGVCSRRDAERLIADGRVTLNGKRLDTPAIKVTPQDDIRVDGKPIAAPEPTRLWRYHKPSGLVTSHRDPEGRPTVFSKLPEGMPRVVSVGRLDLTSEGLLLLTNDGGLARSLELPSTGWVRRYRARAFGSITQAELEKLAMGITVDGVKYGPIDASLDSEKGSNSWLTVAITEGKNREVRRVLEAVGLKVNRLIRLSYGPFQLGNLAPGQVEEVNRKALREQLGRLLPPDPAGAPRRGRPATPSEPAPAPEAQRSPRGKGRAAGSARRSPRAR